MHGIEISTDKLITAIKEGTILHDGHSDEAIVYYGEDKETVMARISVAFDSLIRTAIEDQWEASAALRLRRRCILCNEEAFIMAGEKIPPSEGCEHKVTAIIYVNA